jgi:thymidine phosphorylase
MRRPPVAPHRQVVAAPAAGRVTGVDNRVLSRAAKLAGAPKAPAAGVDVHVRIGDLVQAGQPLFTLHAQAPGELEYAQQYLASRPPIFRISEAA